MLKEYSEKEKLVLVLLQNLELGKKKKKKESTFLNIELPYDPVFQLLDVYPKGDWKQGLEQIFVHWGSCQNYS